jgi:hypothetical protein
MIGAGLQGFQTPIQNDSFIVNGMGAMGNVHQERGKCTTSYIGVDETHFCHDLRFDVLRGRT